MKKMNLVKRMAIATMAAIMAVTAVAPALPVSASSGTGIESQKGYSVKEYNADATVTSSSANVREGAGTEFRVVNTFNKGKTFHIEGVVLKDGEKTNWYQVIVTDKKYGGETAGYIHSSTFKMNGTKDNKNNKGNSKVESGKVMTVSGVKNYLGLRSETSSNDDAEIARLYNGYTVTVLKTEGEYAYVWCNNLGLTGFVKAAYLK